MKIPAECFSRGDEYLKGILCFTKRLIREYSLSPSVIDKALAIQLKLHILLAKQVTVTEEQLEMLLADYLKLYHRLIIQMFASTGLRTSEFRALRPQDISLDVGHVGIQRDKGGKYKCVCLNLTCKELLKQYMDSFQHLTYQGIASANRSPGIDYTNTTIRWVKCSGLMSLPMFYGGPFTLMPTKGGTGQAPDDVWT